MRPESCGKKRAGAPEGPEKSPVQKSPYGLFVECRAGPDVAKADVSWEETSISTKRTTGVWVQASRERFAEITPGRAISQQGLAATCKGLLYKGNPSQQEGFSGAHGRYTQRINLREGRTGHLWQGRFASYAMDERYLLACTRSIEMNPVRVGLVGEPADWPWSSARARLSGRDDTLVKVTPLLEMVGEMISWVRICRKRK
ncbi:MAG: transposase [bacterium]